MNTYRIVRQQPLTKEQVLSGITSNPKEVLLAGISAEAPGYKFAPEFELKTIQLQRRTYYNEHCTEVTDWCFNVTETESNGSECLWNYRIEEESTSQIQKH